MLGPEDGPKRLVLQDLKAPAEWNKKLSDLVDLNPNGAPVYFVCGPKSSGKSTFAKLLTNRLITSRCVRKMSRAWPAVHVLDLDPGQPDFSPPGLVSLNKIQSPNLSPPFAYPALSLGADGPPWAHAVATMSPALDPQHLIECGMDLFTRARAQPNAMLPLVVNTPGWIHGTGLEILIQLIDGMRPTAVIYTSQDGPEETMEGLQRACIQIPLSTLPSHANELTSRTAQHLRTMQMMSYFHLDDQFFGDAAPRWSTTYMTDVRPWRVRYQGQRRGFLGLLFYDHQPPAGLIPDAIDGMILAAVRIDDMKAFRDLLAAHTSPPPPDDSWTEDLVARNDQGIPFIPNPLGRTLDPKYSKALGLVLVRGIDPQRGELHILTPQSGDMLAENGGESQRLVFVSGKFDTPFWAYTESFYDQSFESSARETADITSDDGEHVEEGEGGDEVNAQAAVVGGDVAATKILPSAEDSRDQRAPWVEVLHGSQKRPCGSTIWRVRRDLGRG